MKIFGRTLDRYLLGFLSLPSFLAAVFRAYCEFKDPLSVILGYIVRAHKGVVRLRNGKVIYMSDDPRDIITVFLVFCRRDYGEVASGSNIIDVGANIGVFSLFAAFMGANRVLALEPCQSSYEILIKNIKVNKLEEVISARNVAVTGTACDSVKFPKTSNVLNSILPDTYIGDDYDLVPAVDFHSLIDEMRSVDLLKIDCEGGEYDIFSKSDPQDIKKVMEIRMEYHKGHETLISWLAPFGFAVSLHQPNAANEGNLWLKLGGVN